MLCVLEVVPLGVSREKKKKRKEVETKRAIVERAENRKRE